MKKLLFIALSIAVFTACKEEETVAPTPLSAVVKQDINATYGNYQFFSFATGDTVPLADSASVKWDIAFKGTTILINGGSSGPGVGGVIMMDTLFTEVTAAPAAGYAQDGTEKAIPTGSNNGWYNYAGPPNHTITPLAGRVFVIKTATGKFAKLEFISYYKGAPTAPNGLTDISRFYTIRYIYQPDGSTKLN